MANVEDIVRIFHEPHCEGIITSSPEGVLTCAECGQTIGMVQPAVLDQLLAMLSRVEDALRALVQQIELSEAVDKHGHELQKLTGNRRRIMCSGLPNRLSAPDVGAI